MDLLIKTAIKEENEEYVRALLDPLISSLCFLQLVFLFFYFSQGTDLVFVKYVSANVIGVQGFLFYITFWARDVSEPNPEPVRTFIDEILVRDSRLRPTQEPYVV